MCVLVDGPFSVLLTMVEFQAGPKDRDNLHLWTGPPSLHMLTASGLTYTASEEDAQNRGNPNRRHSFCARNWGKSLITHLTERHFSMLKFYNSFDVQPFYLNMYGVVSQMTYLAAANNIHKFFFAMAMCHSLTHC